MSNIFPLSVVKMPPSSETHNPTCAEILEQVKGLKGFIGPNTLYEAEEHNELLQRVSSCFKDIVKNVNISLSIPNFMRNEAVLENINCKKDLQKLNALCANYLKPGQPTLVPASTLSVDFDYAKLYDSKLLEARELVSRSEPLMEELNKKVYLTRSGKKLMRSFEEITTSDNGSFIGVLDRTKRRSIALKKQQLRDIMNFDAFCTEKEEKPPTVLFLIRQEFLKTQIAERLGRTKEFVRMSELERPQHKIQRLFNAAYGKMTKECHKIGTITARQNAEITRLEAIYQATVKRNIETDKDLIRKKAKLLGQLSNWVKKYDTDVSQKMYTLTLAQEAFAEQKDIAQKFFKEYDRVSAEYSEVVQCQLVQDRLAEYRIEVEKAKAAKLKARKWY